MQNQQNFIFKAVLPLFIVSFLIGCSNSKLLKESFQIAGTNKGELQAVLEHFKSDPNPQKLDAAKYLIVQMKYQYHKEGNSIKRYDSLINVLGNLSIGRMEELGAIWDSLKRELKPPLIDDTYSVCDLKRISAEDLISHINSAFNAWSKPWARDLSYSDFCRYILPYKLVEEKPDKWMKELQQRYESLWSVNFSENNSYKMCLKVNARLKKDFKIRSFPSFVDLNFHDLDRLKSGKCFHATQYSSYVMRALGIAVVMDFTPYWGNMNGGHEWNALIYKNRPVPFIGSESDPGLTKIDLARQRKRAKVFRRVFNYQTNSLAALAQDDLEIPAVFRSSHIIDVTAEYIPVSTIVINNLSLVQKSKVLYLCVFNRQKWVPTAWAKINSNKSVFLNMGRDIVYLPAFYQYGELTPVGFPVFLGKDGRCKVLKDDGKRTKLVVRSKSPEGPNILKGQEYELLIWNGKWKMLNKSIASADSIVYSKLPTNALYRIKSKDKASKERIFMIQNEKQVWK
ncbi:hypothetical protein [Pedobacter sp. MW01-1-1]|uniref:hypothetical protein n=1 Tax=Pedobacter sp. MW01-1-1 TaxID=3383027 RepID=UPI003FF02FD6